MKFELGNPEHGWVGVKLELADTCLKFFASDVPNDPIEGLIDAIRTVAAGREVSLWWHLEPDGWYFEFTPTPQGVRLQALYAENSDRAAAELRGEYRGSLDAVLLPLWRGLRRFETYAPAAPHWPVLRPGAVASLRAVIEQAAAKN
ncbi:MAG: hypothetical protein ABWY06_02740 [Pseudomonas sp.]|uniref:hypothetical protein n=1 Tax=Pseudomonas sp. TaxID=306 RepID=UPI003396A0EE